MLADDLIQDELYLFTYRTVTEPVIFLYWYMDANIGKTYCFYFINQNRQWAFTKEFTEYNDIVKI